MKPAVLAFLVVVLLRLRLRPMKAIITKPDHGSSRNGPFSGFVRDGGAETIRTRSRATAFILVRGSGKRIRRDRER